MNHSAGNNNQSAAEIFWEPLDSTVVTQQEFDDIDERMIAEYPYDLPATWKSLCTSEGCAQSFCGCLPPHPLKVLACGCGENNPPSNILPFFLKHDNPHSESAKSISKCDIVNKKDWIGFGTSILIWVIMLTLIEQLWHFTMVASMELTRL
jgi:hypothetical protein